MALSLYLFHNTGSAVVLSSVLAASMLASIYLSPIAGGFADHFPKRNVLLIANLGLAALAVGIGISATSDQGYAALFALIVISGGFDAVIAVTLQAAVRDLSDDHDLVRVNALTVLLQNAPLIAGPPLGAWLYVSFDFLHISYANAASFVLAGVIAMALPRHRPEAVYGSWITMPFRGARDGLALLWRDRDMRSTQLAYSLSNVGNGLSAGVISAFVISRASNPETSVAAYATAGTVGVLGVSVAMMLWRLPGSRSRWVIAGLMIGVLGGRLPLLATATWLSVALIGFVRSAALEASNAPLLAIWQQATPREQQGRIFGARRLLAQGPYPIAVWLGGFIAEEVGYRTEHAHGFDGMSLVIVIGAAIELVAVVLLARWSGIARLERRRSVST